VTTPLQTSADVAAALADGRPVVALESTVVAHGLPRPDNLRVALAVEQVVRDHGAVPATVAVLDGTVHVGLTSEQLARVADETLTKLSVRDLGPAVARGASGSTTVAATARLARLVGVEVMATGGLGGVHRAARDTWDESADLATLATTGIVVVCAGVKSVLDVAATLERLETLGVTVVGYRTDRFPAFYLSDSGAPVDWRVDDPAEVAAIVAARLALGLHRSSVVVAQPVATEVALQPAEHRLALADGLAAAAAGGVTGKDVTPFLLAWLHTATAGASLRANESIIRANASLGAEVAVALRAAGAAAPDPAGGAAPATASRGSRPEPGHPGRE
jgi:pseudouridine-5'-phosphate glycosidase